MKKVFFISCFLSIIFLFFFSIKTSASFTKYQNNPVLQASPDQFDGNKIWAPHVLFENNKYKMWYHGCTNTNCRIFYAESTNDISWNKNPNVLIQPFIEKSEKDAGEPMVLHIGNTYYMWYNRTHVNNTYSLGYATSSDGINWNVRNDPVLTGNAGAWDSIGITSPDVYFDGSIYILWYSSSTTQNNWRIGYATSLDGINWIKFDQNPLSLPQMCFAESGSTIKIDGTFHKWYYTGCGRCTNFYHAISTDGIYWTCDGECSVLESGNLYDDWEILSPTVLKKESQYFMWYSSDDHNTRHISYATQGTVQEKDAVIIIPGFFASWNKNALLHNQDVSWQDWKLNNAVQEYSGIIQTLKNLGYQEGINLFVFPYDWRKKLDDNTQYFNEFLQQKIWNQKPNQQITIIGHSLGGLVGRIWTQKYNNNVHHLITVGSPHKGTVQTYKPLEAGEIDRENTFLWLAEKIILVLNKSTIETDKTTMQNKFPVLFDLFPTFDFLKNENGVIISTNNLSITNNTLNNYNASLSSYYLLLTTLYGTIGDTQSGFITKPADPFQSLLNNYSDGQPILTLFETGDQTVLKKSSQEDSDSIELPYDHGDIIVKSNSIKKILDAAEIPYTENDVVEGSKTKISSSLIFLIKSPAVIEVGYNGTTYFEEEGMIFIPYAESGEYILKVDGQYEGDYSLIVGQISEQNDVWDEINGTIKDSEQTDVYNVTYNNQIAQSFIPTLTITPTETPTPTSTPIPTPTLTPTITETPTPTNTPTPSPTPTSTTTPIYISQTCPTTTSTQSSSSIQTPWNSTGTNSWTSVTPTTTPTSTGIARYAPASTDSPLSTPTSIQTPWNSSNTNSWIPKTTGNVLGEKSNTSQNPKKQSYIWIYILLLVIGLIILLVLKIKKYTYEK